MGRYASAAIKAAESLVSGQLVSPRDAWEGAVAIEYPTKMQSRRKGCPRGAFIGLCEAGLVHGVERSGSANTTKNGMYAVAAAKALNRNPGLMQDKSALWKHACTDQPKAQNGQMES